MGKFNFFGMFRKGVDDKLFNTRQFQIEALALAQARFDEHNGSYDAARESLSQIKLSEEQKDAVIGNLIRYHQMEQKQKEFDETVRQAQALINENKKREAYELVFSLYKKDTRNIKLIELLTNIAETYRTEEEVLRFFDYLAEDNEAERYNIKYRKGLFYKQNKRYEEAIEIFNAQNAEYEFAWNYYQIAITENLRGNTDACFTNLEKAFELDPSLREEAKRFPELANLHNTRKFIALTT